MGVRGTFTLRVNVPLTCAALFRVLFLANGQKLCYSAALFLFEEREADWIDANGLCKIFFRKRNRNNTNIIHETLHL